MTKPHMHGSFCTVIWKGINHPQALLSENTNYYQLSSCPDLWPFRELPSRIKIVSKEIKIKYLNQVIPQRQAMQLTQFSWPDNFKNFQPCEELNILCLEQICKP